VPGSTETSSDPRRRDPSRRVIEILARRWAIPIILVLSHGPERFGNVQRRLPGVVHKVLTDHLRFLERAGVVEKLAYGHGARSLYRLSTKGTSLLPIIAAMQALAHLWDHSESESDTR
jgi:DNA-binding HxlR family transcriptional regulator